jgi:hypothetical protein
MAVLITNNISNLDNITQVMVQVANMHVLRL